MITLHIIGTPRPQGSKQAFVRGGRATVVNAGNQRTRESLAAWRTTITHAARTHLEGDGEHLPPDRPVGLSVTFALPKPASARKTDAWAWKKPDLDKLVRALCDGLEDGGLLANDSRIVSLMASKRYARPGEPSGALVRLWQVTEPGTPT